jgi:hypothetical protein
MAELEAITIDLSQPYFVVYWEEHPALGGLAVGHQSANGWSKATAASFLMMLAGEFERLADSHEAAAPPAKPARKTAPLSDLTGIPAYLVCIPQVSADGKKVRVRESDVYFNTNLSDEDTLVMLKDFAMQLWDEVDPDGH